MIIMESIFRTSMEELPLLKHGRSRSINAENPHGEKGKGAMSASVLGAARKGSPCVNALRALSGVNALHCACVSRENACIMKTVR